MTTIAVVTLDRFNEIDSFVASYMLGRVNRPGWRVAIACPTPQVTSMNGVAPGPNSGAYGSTKAAVALLTQQMALEWGPHGIRSNAVAPGLIDAGMSEPIYADPDIRRRRAARVPLGRLGTPQHVADAVLFLLSDAAAYINGVELLVDGGVTSSVISTLPRPLAVDTVGLGTAPTLS